MSHLEIRIKRSRTPDRTGTFEILERWASLEGRTAANALEVILESREQAERFAVFIREARNPGRETT
jgi:hypothetical protein